MNQDKPPLPELGPEWTPYWRNKVHAQMRAYADTCTAALSAQVAELEADAKRLRDALEEIISIESCSPEGAHEALAECHGTARAAIDAAMKEPK